MDFSDELVHALETVGPDAVLLETGSPEALALASSLVKARPARGSSASGWTMCRCR
jgi:hypothetical protein